MNVRDSEDGRRSSGYGLRSPLIAECGTPIVVGATERSSTIARAEVDAAGQQMFDIVYKGKDAQFKVGQLNIQILSGKATTSSSRRKVCLPLR